MSIEYSDNLPVSFKTADNLISSNDSQIQNIDINNLKINVSKIGNYFDGYNLFSLNQRNKTSMLPDACSLLITDMDGNIILERKRNATNIGIRPPKFINSTTMLTGDNVRVIFWNIYTDETFIVDKIYGHHDLEYNPKDQTLFTFGITKNTIGNMTYSFDVIREYDLTGKLVWTLDTSTFVSHTQWCPFRETFNDGSADVTHANTIFFDAEEDVIYLNFRNTNTFYKINHTTGEVIWGLGQYGNFTLYNKEGQVRENLFYHPHSVEKVDDNTFILFDNDLHNLTNPNNKHSRILEITINEETMTANESWVWTSPREYYCCMWGDADRLPNGNRLGTFGVPWSPVPSDIGGRIVEVNDIGDIVWEMNFLHTEDYMYGIYRTECFRYSPILDSPSDIETISPGNLSVSWQAWYNFRSRYKMEGTYALYLNGQELEAGPHTFDKFWRPTTMNFTLMDLERGLQHNLTLVVVDEGGHTTSDSLNITIVNFYIHRSGSTVIEGEPPTSLLRWSGEALSPLWFELTVDNELVASGDWTGEEDIVFDSTSLKLGEHLIQLVMHNDSLLLYNDTFILTKYPATPPEFLVTPGDQTFVWNDPQVLSWEIFDYTPKEWALYLNGTLQLSTIWSEQKTLINWSVPQLCEGVYNVTLVAFDHVNLFTVNSLLLTICSPSPPVISATPPDTEVWWRQEGVILRWEVHGGIFWQLFKNDSFTASGQLTGHFVDITLTDWGTDWLPGAYKLTFQVVDIHSNTATTSCWLTIRLGDAYANQIVSSASIYYEDGQKALGAPDGQYATIYVDYSNGYLTLDMGVEEEIFDGVGVDFKVVASGSNYRVWVGNELSEQFTVLGISQGNQSFDLSASGLVKVRYVQIGYLSEGNVLLDAVEAFHFHSPEFSPSPATSTKTTGQSSLLVLGIVIVFSIYAALNRLKAITKKKKRTD